MKQIPADALLKSFAEGQGRKRRDGHYANGGVREITGPDGILYIVKRHRRLAGQPRRILLKLAREMGEYYRRVAKAGIPVPERFQVVIRKQNDQPQLYEIATAEGQDYEERLASAATTREEARQMIKLLLERVISPLLKERNPETDRLPRFGVNLKLRNLCSPAGLDRIAFVDFMVPKLVRKGRFQAEFPPLKSQRAQLASIYRHLTIKGIVTVLLADIAAARPAAYPELAYLFWGFLDRAGADDVLKDQLTGKSALARFRSGYGRRQRLAVEALDIGQPEAVPVLRAMAGHFWAHCPPEKRRRLGAEYRRVFIRNLHFDSDDYPEAGLRAARQTLLDWLKAASP